MSRLRLETGADIRRAVRSTFTDLDLPGQRLLARMRVRLEESVTSTAVHQEDTRLVLTVNPAFVRRFIRTAADMRLLILHELFHVRLGHLHIDATGPMAGLALDALINAQICRIHSRYPDWALLRRVYPEGVFPTALLRPPGAWKTAPRWPFDGRLGAIHRALYTSEVSVTWREIQEALESAGGMHIDEEGDVPVDSELSGPDEDAGTDEPGKEMGNENGEEFPEKDETNEFRDEPEEDDDDEKAICISCDEILLLGNHEEHLPPVEDPALHALIGQCLHAATSLDAGDYGGPHHGLGDEEVRFRLRPMAPHLSWTRILQQAIRTLRNLPPGMRLHEDLDALEARLPGHSRHDRRAQVLAQFGTSSLLQRHRLQETDFLIRDRIHLYLDVSGSVAGYLPQLYGALQPFVHHFHPVVHLFSYKVRHRPIAALHLGEVVADQGTSLQAVVDHRGRLPHAPALIVTDGISEPVTLFHASRAFTAPTRVVLIEGEDAPIPEVQANVDAFRQAGWDVIRLPQPAFTPNGLSFPNGLPMV